MRNILFPFSLLLMLLFAQQRINAQNCTLTANGFSNLQCNDNGTPNDANDDSNYLLMGTITGTGNCSNGNSTATLCDITGMEFDNISPCPTAMDNSSGATDFFTVDIVVNFANPATTGFLALNDNGGVLSNHTVSVANIVGNSYTFVGIACVADGTPINVTAFFTAENTCSLTQLGPAVQSCVNTAPPSCTITVDFFGNPSACNDNGTPNDPGDDFFTQNIHASFFNRPSTGNLQIVPGGDQIGAYSIPVSQIVGNQHLFTAVQLKANGTPSVVQMNFTDNSGCIDADTGPTVQPCSTPPPPCTITVDFFGNPSACNDNGTPNDPGDDFFTQNIHANFFNRPSTGNLQIVPGGDQIGAYSIPVSQIVGNSHLFTAVQLKANGTPSVVQMNFTDNSGCIDADTGPTVQPCSTPPPPCTITVDFFGNPSACNDNGTPNDPGDDFFTQNIHASFFNRPSTGNLQIVPGGDQIGTYSIPVSQIVGNSHLFTAVQLKADGTPSVVQMNFTDNSGCIDADTGPTVQPCQSFPPVLTCPPPASVSCASEVPAINPATVSETHTCAGNVTIVHFSDAPSNQTGANAFTITRIYTASDQCGQTGTCSQTITVNDPTPPTITCPAGSTAGPSNSVACTAIVSNINASAADNCGTVSLGFALTGATMANGSGQASGQTFNTGQTTVTYTATDGNGRTASCQFVVNVSPCISGRIIWEQDNTSGVKDVTVALTGEQNATTVTGIDGVYGFALSSGSNFNIRPSKNLNKLNGVNASDVFRLQQHLSGNPLTDPYLLVAADVNSNNVITPLDVNIIQLSLLGNTQALAQMVKSWRFVPTAHVMSNPPFGFPESINLTGVSGNQANKDFFGIKVGDVVPVSANPANLTAEPALVLTVSDKILLAGQDLEVDFRANQTEDLAAFQFGLRFDPEHLQLMDIQPLTAVPMTNANFGTYQAGEGKIKILWAGMNSTDVLEAALIFRLKFKVLESGGTLSKVLSLDDETLLARAYNGQMAESAVQLRYTGTTTATDPNSSQLRLQLLQNQPNPFSGQTMIGFELPEACTAQLRIFDTNGKVLALRSKQYAPGQHQEVFELEGMSGVLYYELATPFGVLSQKMVVLAK